MLNQVPAQRIMRGDIVVFDVAPGVQNFVTVLLADRVARPFVPLGLAKFPLMMSIMFDFATGPQTLFFGNDELLFVNQDRTIEHEDLLAEFPSGPWP